LPAQVIHELGILIYLRNKISNFDAKGTSYCAKDLYYT
jgi:hypothetical protein